MITQAEIVEFAVINGAREVHRSWRDTMIKQSRNVAPNRMVFDELSPQDKELDIQIAHDVILDFMVWYESHMDS